VDGWIDLLKTHFHELTLTEISVVVLLLPLGLLTLVHLLVLIGMGSLLVEGRSLHGELRLTRSHLGSHAIEKRVLELRGLLILLGGVLLWQLLVLAVQLLSHQQQLVLVLLQKLLLPLELLEHDLLLFRRPSLSLGHVHSQGCIGFLVLGTSGDQLGLLVLRLLLLLGKRLLSLGLEDLLLLIGGVSGFLLDRGLCL
jgi:hypothetical protein